MAGNFALNYRKMLRDLVPFGHIADPGLPLLVVLAGYMDRMLHVQYLVFGLVTALLLFAGAPFYRIMA